MKKMITGILEKAETNQWGFTTIYVNGKRFGADKKGYYGAQVGDTVEFESYDKPGTGAHAGKSFATVKFTTLRKVAVSAAPAVPGNTSGGGTPSFKSDYQLKQEYWDAKEKRDIDTSPRISLQGAYKVAVEFLPVALAHGAIPAFDKAKAPAKLEILQAFLDEEAQRIHAASYAAKVPTADKAEPVAAADSDKPATVTETDEQWS